MPGLCALAGRDVTTFRRSGGPMCRFRDRPFDYQVSLEKG
jgi:hypothetical protein